MKIRRVNTNMSQRNRTNSKKPTMKPNVTLLSGNSSTQSNSNSKKSNNSGPNLPPLPGDMTNTIPDTTQNPNDQNFPNPNPSLMKPTGTLNVSAGAKRKLTNDEVKFEKLNRELKENVQGVGGILLVLGTARNNDVLKADGMVVMQQSEKLCDDLTNLARKYEYVYNGLNGLVQATVWGAVITDVATIALAIAANHGMSIPGLTAQVQMEVAA